MQPGQEIRKLNSIRALAVIIVIVSHFSNESGMLGGILGQGAGQIGVMLFFLLSAFLMAHLYLDVTPTKENIKNFAFARIARVIPLFLFVVLLSYIAHQVSFLPIKEYFYSIPDTASFASHLLLLSGASVLWSIPPEIYFYVLFALLWAAKKYIGDLIVVAPVALFVASLFIPPQKALETKFFGIYVKLSILQVYPYFCAGLLLGFCYKWRKKLLLLSSHAWVFVLLVIPLLYPNILVKATGITNGLWSDPRLLIALSATFFALVFLVPERNIILENPLGDFLGKISYSIYLLHYPILLMLKAAGFIQGFVGLGIFIGITLLVSWVSFKFLEVPSRIWIRARLGS